MADVDAGTGATIPPGHRSGFVAVLGRPNVGKSTLVNALVGRKISIVTPRPQTTRHAIVGVLTRPAAQLLFVDTPGLNPRGRQLINRAMNRAVQGALGGADAALMVIEAAGWQQGDDQVFDQVRAAGCPAILAVNKIDRLRPRSRLLPLLDGLGGREGFVAVVPVAARTGENIDRLLELATGLLPEGPPLYPLDATTDRGLAFRVAEVVREQLLLQLRQEVPYGLAVEVESLEERPGVHVVGVVIWASRESHKGIVIGRGGAALKAVGMAARLELERLFGGRFHLETHVRVKKDWADSERALQQFGFETGP
jgi:GTP-binding protein Era